MNPSLPTEDLTDAQVIRRLAKQYGIHPEHRLSQNFLIDRDVLTDMVEKAQPKPGEWIIEIGAGFGTLTEALLATGADITAFEIDERLVAALVARFRDNKRFSVVAGDFFRWFREHSDILQTRPFRIVANLPYNVTSHFFATVLDAPVQPLDITVMIQKEVAERISAKPGSMSLLAVTVQYFGTPAYVRTVHRSSFWPQPDVDSAILHINAIQPAEKDKEAVFRLARMAFAGKRKQVHNTLGAGLHKERLEMDGILKTAGISGVARPQELSVVDWKRLAKAQLFL